MEEINWFAANMHLGKLLLYSVVSCIELVRFYFHWPGSRERCDWYCSSPTSESHRHLLRGRSAETVEAMICRSRRHCRERNRLEWTKLSSGLETDGTCNSSVCSFCWELLLDYTAYLVTSVRWFCHLMLNSYTGFLSTAAGFNLHVWPHLCEFIYFKHYGLLLILKIVIIALLL